MTTTWETKRFYDYAYPNEMRGRNNFYGDYTLGELRRQSSELDFGVWWRVCTSTHTFRVTFIDDTFEVVLFNLHAGTVEVIASGISEEQVRAALDGWTDACETDDGVQWVRERLRDFPPALLDSDV